MIARLSEHLTAYISKHKYLTESEQEVYRYCLNLIIGKILYITAIITYGLILKRPFLAITFLSVMMPLRLFVGGAHASSEVVCFIISYSTAFITIALIPAIVLNLPEIAIILIYTISMIPIVMFAPVDHKNKRMVGIKRIKLRQKSLFLIIVLSLSILVLIRYQQWLYIGMISGCAFICSINIIIGIIINMRDHDSFNPERK